MNLNIASISLLLLLASTAKVAESGIFDIQKYGAKPNGDITQVYIYTAINSCWLYSISLFFLVCLTGFDKSLERSMRSRRYKQNCDS
jgi:hypothetical protein